eukprot:8288635-Alexandrium_andersonii.AAC.1
MSASLVGSEMCIRDSFHPRLEPNRALHLRRRGPAILALREAHAAREAVAVSYTHLTLPTICSV